MVVLLLLVVATGAWFWAQRTSRYPYPDGSSHSVTADCTGSLNGGCWIHLGPSTPSQEWTGAINPPSIAVPPPEATPLPPGWAGHRVQGTLHIIHSWGAPEAATFTSGGCTIAVWGGRPDGRHFFPA